MTAPPRGRLASSAVVTSLALLVSMALGAVVALIVQLRFGKDAETDGLFAAYGVYGVITVVAASFRSTIVARLVEGPSLFAALDRYLGAAVAIFAVAGVPLVILGDPIAHLLVGDVGRAATDTARTALILFWLAAGTQLVSSLLAAALAVRDDFGFQGLAYVAGGVLSIAGLLALAPALGIQAVPAALLAGGVTTAAMLTARLAGLGYRPRALQLAPDLAALRRAGLLVWAAMGAVAGQVIYVATIGFAARIGEGAPTLYTYGYFLMILFAGALGGAMTIVMAPRVAEEWDGRAESLFAPLADVFRAGAVLLVPVIGFIAIGGAELAGLVFNAHDAREVVAVFLGLSAGLVATAAVPVPQLAMYTRGRYTEVAALSLIGVVLQLGLCAAVVGLDWLPALALAATVTGLVLALVLFVLVFGRRWTAATWIVLREFAPLALVAAVAFVPAGVLATVAGGAVRPAAGALGLVAYGLIARATLPRHWEPAERLIQPLRGRFARRGAPSA